MKVPSEKEQEKQKRIDWIYFFGGILFGILFFGLAGSRLFSNGFENVELYTWIALGFGVISFGFLSKWFGSQFWENISTLFNG